ncbi:hypothetical protein FE257_000596 [Aspergillus nanangensis]|uniref:Xylanolytic transcriptional activator regulatory domain-containing protein n=1 Tax=Aspergillus nanangensis TaxID=2582783 RepID=A0AAD4GQ85_ASPNN|nr:hypothetical protein FE257_000596 [Aspergillus nanangensis]
MELTFHIGPESKGTKRKSTGGACDQCRRSKSHSPQTPADAPISSRVRPAAGYQLNQEQEPISTQINRRQNGSSGHRFIGDLNPIIFFVGDASARLLRGRANQGDCGIWLDKENEILEHDEEIVSDRAPFGPTAEASYRQRPEDGRKLPILPPKRSQEMLVDIYFRRIHPVLPLIDESDFRTQFQEGTISSWLLQAICLVASKDPDATSILRLEGRTGTVPSREFSNLLYDDLTLAVALKLERTRLTLIRILALLSLHNPGPKSFEEGSMYLVQAIQHAFTIGIHLNTGGVTEETKPFIALFWSLWSLDKWNGAVHGRPLVIHERDLGQQLPDIINLFDAPFRVWLSLASTMGEVTAVYRPMLDASFDENKPEIPRFEEILETFNGKEIPMEQMLSLELAYHGIEVLSSRPWGLRAQPKSRTLYLRQDLAVHRIATLMQMCDVRQFLPLPMISYCISLAFALSYKQLKRCKLPSTQHTAKQHVKTFYRSLEALSPTWWLAKIMTRLSERALDGTNNTAERQEQQLGSTSSTKRPFGDLETPATDTFSSMPSAYSEPRSLESVERSKEQQTLPNGTSTAKNQMPYDSTYFGSGNFDDFAADPMFDPDIDNFLGNFLNINIPTAPSHPLFIDPAMTWNSGGVGP